MPVERDWNPKSKRDTAGVFGVRGKLLCGICVLTTVTWGENHKRRRKRNTLILYNREPLVMGGGVYCQFQLIRIVLPVYIWPDSNASGSTYCIFVVAGKRLGGNFRSTKTREHTARRRARTHRMFTYCRPFTRPTALPYSHARLLTTTLFFFFFSKTMRDIKFV